MMRAAWVPKKKIVCWFELIFAWGSQFNSYSNCCIFWAGNIAKISFKRYCFWGVFGDGQKKVLQSQIWFHEWKSKNYAVGWFCKIEFFGDCYCGFYVGLYGWWSLFLLVWLRWMEVFGNNEPTLTLWFCHAFFRLMFFCWRLDTENGALM